MMSAISQQSELLLRMDEGTATAGAFYHFLKRPIIKCAKKVQLPFSEMDEAGTNLLFCRRVLLHYL